MRQGFQDGQLIASAGVHHTGDAGRVVGHVRLELAALQRFAHGLAFQHAVPDGIGLVAVCDDELAVQLAHRMIDDKGRIFHGRRIEGFGLDAVVGGGEDAVARFIDGNFPPCEYACFGFLLAKTEAEGYGFAKMGIAILSC